MKAEDAMLRAMERWKDFHNRAVKSLRGTLHAAVPRNVSPLRHIGGYEHSLGEPKAGWSSPTGVRTTTPDGHAWGGARPEGLTLEASLEAIS